MNVSDVSISTWNDLRVESVFALLSGFVGLVGVILTLKPFSLKINRRITLILAICGMVISCEFSTYLPSYLTCMYLPSSPTSYISTDQSNPKQNKKRNIKISPLKFLLYCEITKCHDFLISGHILLKPMYGVDYI